MKKIIIGLAITGFLYVLLVASTNLKKPGKGNDESAQKDIDMSTTPAKLAVSGTPLGNVSISHNGRQVSPDSSIRDSYTNMSSPEGTIKQGTIFTKRVFMKNKDGSKGCLEMVFGMIKHKAGYFPAGGDWEYIVMSIDEKTDFRKNPNGILPSVTDNEMRGKIVYCGVCHASASGKDYVFSN